MLLSRTPVDKEPDEPSCSRLEEAVIENLVVLIVGLIGGEAVLLAMEEPAAIIDVGEAMVSCEEVPSSELDRLIEIDSEELMTEETTVITDALGTPLGGELVNTEADELKTEVLANILDKSAGLLEKDAPVVLLDRPAIEGLE